MTHLLHSLFGAMIYLLLSMVTRQFFYRSRLKRFRRRHQVLVEAARSAGYEAGRRACLKELEQGKVYR